MVDRVYLSCPLIYLTGHQSGQRGIDYELEYKDNMDPGKATIIVKGIGAYYGVKNIHFNIKPKKPDIYTLCASLGCQTPLRKC